MKNTVSLLFIFLFFMKMVITAVPLFYSFANNGVVSAVILQLEIEENEKANDKIKESIFKNQYAEFLTFSFEMPAHYLTIDYPATENKQPIQSFYPPVPTPPPNARI